jgi:hypothetical protein
MFRFHIKIYKIWKKSWLWFKSTFERATNVRAPKTNSRKVQLVIIYITIKEVTRKRVPEPIAIPRKHWLVKKRNKQESSIWRNEYNEWIN